MDALLFDLQNVCTELLPILGALALIFLCILLKKIWKAVDNVNDKITKLDPTVTKVNESMDKIQAPLDTAVKYSHSLDKVHDKTAEVFGKAADFANDNIEKLQDAITDKMAGSEKEEAQDSKENTVKKEKTEVSSHE